MTTTDRRPRVLGLGGSLQEVSCTLTALEAALAGATLAGAAVELLDLKKLSLPMYDERLRAYPSGVSTLIERARWADGLILASPVYHGTLSGALKNALDFLEFLAQDDPPWLEGKVVGLISVAGGGHGVNTINSMLHTCRALRAWVLPTAVAVPGSAFSSDGRLQDKNTKERLLKVGREVAHFATILAGERQNR